MRRYLLIILVHCSLLTFAQEVIKDHVYVKENLTTPHRFMNREQFWKLNFLFDSARSPLSVVKINYYNKYFASAPIRLEECVYVDPAMLLSNSLQTPPEGQSFRFYAEALNYTDTTQDLSGLMSYFSVRKKLEELFQPFYFKETEVTNKEYRQFVYWVRDSIARRHLVNDSHPEYFLHPELGNGVLDHRRKINWDQKDIAEVLEVMFLPRGERFYHRKEIDAGKLIYTYSERTGEVKKINVYPDTMVWVDQFQYAWSEPLTNMYFWHPAFDDYPVVGITQTQAKAFLHWKTKMMEEELSNSSYTVEYSLPSELEWEMMATAKNEKGKIRVLSPTLTRFYDHGYMTDLQIDPDSAGVIEMRSGMKRCEPCSLKVTIPAITADELNNKPLTEPRPLEKWIPATLYSSSFSYRKDHKNCPYSDSLKNRLIDENGIAFMGGSVSEWLSDTYQKNWLPMYDHHQKKLVKLNNDDALMLLALEKYYDTTNDKNGTLVRGGNWYDYSESVIHGKDFEGINKKVFLDPTKAFATVGFRYIVKVKRKDELKLLIKELPPVGK